MTHRVVSLLALVAAAVVFLPTAPDARRTTGAELFAAQAVTQPWPIKDFEVLNVEPAGIGQLGSVAAFLRSLNIDADNPLDLNIWKTVELPNEIRTAIESHLRVSAEILERWGFPPPRLEPVVTRRDGRRAYRVYLVSDLTVAGVPTAGVYHLTPSSGGRETVISLNAASVIETAPDVPSWVRPSGLQTVGHELFHAVQFAMPLFVDGTSPGEWITEGTARAVAWDLVRLSPDPDFVFVDSGHLWGGRSYSARLPVPWDTGPSPDAYATSSFWRYLAEFQAARQGHGLMPGPDLNPVDYSYLAEMFQRGPLARDCDHAGAACAADIRWLDAQLLSLFGRPLHEMYPRFIDAAAFYGEHRISSVSGGDPDTHGRSWREGMFSRNCPRVLLAPAPQGRVHRDVIPQFDDVAAQCWEIWVESGDGVERPIEVRADAPPGATALADLWGGVGGLRVCPVGASQAECSVAEAASLEVDAETGHPQAVWILDPVPDGGDSFFLLSNVARSPAATTRMTNLPITFTLLDPRAEVSVSGAVTGNFEVTLGEALTGPAGMSFSVSYDPPHAPGECLITMWLTQEVGGRRGDSLHILGLLSPPLRPGRYPVRFNAGSNEFAAEFWASHSGRPPIHPFPYFHSRGGTLELQSVSRSAVVGRFDIAMRSDPIIEVAGTFAIPPTSLAPRPFTKLHPDDPCLPSRPPPEPGTPGPGGPPGGGGPPNPPTVAPPAGGPGPGAAPGGGGGNLPGTPGGRAGGPGRGAGPGAGGASPGGGGRGLTGAGLTLQFLEGGTGALRSAPQAVQGTGSPTQVTVSSGAFTLALALPTEAFLTCASRQTDPAGTLAVLGLGRSQGGRLLIDVADGSLRLDATTGAVQLDVGFARGTLTVRGLAPAVVGLTPQGQTTVRGDVTGGTLDVTIDRQRVTCGGLMDFAFLVTGTR